MPPVCREHRVPLQVERRDGTDVDGLLPVAQVDGTDDLVRHP